MPERALQVFDEMQQQGLQRNVSRSLQFFDKMRRQSLHPYVITYSPVIGAWGKWGRQRRSCTSPMNAAAGTSAQPYHEHQR